MPRALSWSRNSILKLSLVSLVIFVVISLNARADEPTPEQAARAVAGLTRESRAVIDRLTELRELPDGQWKTHPGDLAHGEAVDLDDSGWEAIALKSELPNRSAWFRQTYEVPQTLHGYDPSGVRIWFQFHASATGPMPEIIYFNGRRVAMGDDLEPILLFNNARPGDRVTVAVKLMLTVDKKTINGATLKIDFPAARPSPEDLREEFLSAALLVPSLVPNATSEMSTLNRAIGAVDLKALDAKDQNEFDDSLRDAHNKLGALVPVVELLVKIEW